MRNTDGTRGWRIDYDRKKEGHINWWYTDKNIVYTGAIKIENANENVYREIIAHFPKKEV